MGQQSSDSQQSSHPEVISPAEQLPSEYPLETSPLPPHPSPEYEEDIPLTIPAEPYPSAYQYLAQSQTDSLIKPLSPERYPYGFAPPPPRSRRRVFQIWLIAGTVAVVVIAALGVIVFRDKVSNPSQVKRYAASVPGPCDTRGGTWAAESDTQTACQEGKLHITSGNLADVDFFGSPSIGTIAKNYEVSVDVSPLDSQVAGVVVHYSPFQQTGYEVNIASSGSWGVNARGGDGNSNLPSGNISPMTTYHLDVKIKGATATVSINGQLAVQFTDPQFPTGQSIALDAYPEADFQNFIYMSLS
jgi:hypothetical protein